MLCSVTKPPYDCSANITDVQWQVLSIDVLLHHRKPGLARLAGEVVMVLVASP